jgi:hypothetical protein
MRWRSLLIGACLATAGRAVVPRLLLLKFTRDVAKLNAGDHTSLLAAHADDFVLHFNERHHRWSGDWIGKSGMDRFLQNFTAAKIQGEIGQIAISGPPCALTLWAL